MKFSSKKIIIIFLICFTLSSIWLSYKSERILDLNYEKNWWSTYFIEPKSESLSFIIENHSDKESFEIEIFSKKDKLGEINIEIKKGDMKIIKEEDFEFKIEKNDRITFKISSDLEIREIYKNL
jgi:hypothetical protein